MTDSTGQVPEPGEQLPPKALSLDDIEDGVRRLLVGLGQSEKKEVR